MAAMVRSLPRRGEGPHCRRPAAALERRRRRPDVRMADVRITLLGSIGVTDAPEDPSDPDPGRPSSTVYPLTGRRRQAVLALLALHRGELVSVDCLLDAV